MKTHLDCVFVVLNYQNWYCMWYTRKTTTLFTCFEGSWTNWSQWRVSGRLQSRKGRCHFKVLLYRSLNSIHMLSGRRGLKNLYHVSYAQWFQNNVVHVWVTWPISWLTSFKRSLSADARLSRSHQRTTTRISQLFLLLLLFWISQLLLLFCFLLQASQGFRRRPRSSRLHYLQLPAKSLLARHFSTWLFFFIATIIKIFPLHP